jgi:hypothetical protein
MKLRPFLRAAGPTPIYRAFPAVLFLALLAGSVWDDPAAGAAEAPRGALHPLAPGLEFGTFDLGRPGGDPDSLLWVVRVEPRGWEIRILTTALDRPDSTAATARDWCREHGLVFATNAGMFGPDLSHVGRLKVEDRILTSYDHPRYQSVAAFGPKRPEIPAFRLVDIDEETWAGFKDDYGTVVQNLRLIKHPRENRWSPQPKKWSEMALGEDEEGRALFLFTRTPFSMHDWNERVLRVPIGLVAAQHLEGGPEAQFYLKIGDVEIEKFGSYETGFWLTNGNQKPWPIPNVIGIAPKTAEEEGPEPAPGKKPEPPPQAPQ